MTCVVSRARTSRCGMRACVGCARAGLRFSAPAQGRGRCAAPGRLRPFVTRGFLSLNIRSPFLYGMHQSEVPVVLGRGAAMCEVHRDAPGGGTRCETCGSRSVLSAARD